MHQIDITYFLYIHLTQNQFSIKSFFLLPAFPLHHYLLHNPFNRIMIYQLEKLDNLEYEISKFLGIKQFTMERHNVGERKWYSKISASYVLVI